MRVCSLLLFAVVCPSILAATTAAKPKVVAKPVQQSLTIGAMPEATVGVQYKKLIAPKTIPWKNPTCVLAGSHPAWLTIGCTNAGFEFAGVPLTVATATNYEFSIVVVDGTTGSSYKYSASLTERPADEKIDLGSNTASGSTAPSTPSPDYKKLCLQETTPIAEGGIKAEGEIQHLPANQTLHIQFWTRPEGRAGTPATLMTLVSPAGAPTTVQQVDVKGNKYSAQFPSPLAAGQTVTIVVVTDDGTQVRTLLDKTLSSGLDIGTMMLKVEEPVAVGATIVKGKLSCMPDPAVNPQPAQGSTPVTYGNFPGIVVWVRDVASGKWSQAAPAIGASSSQFLSVNADGSFQVTLPSQLQIGQKIRVDVVPPPKRFFISGGARVAALLPPPATVVSYLSKELKVFNNTVLSEPTITTSPFYEGTTVISGTATIPSSGVPAGIAVLRLNNQASRPRTAIGNSNGSNLIVTDEDVPLNSFSRCLQMSELSSPTVANYGRLLALTTSSSNTFVGTVDASAGTYKVTLAQALKQGDWVQIVQVLPAGAQLPAQQSPHCASGPVQVTYPYTFFRTNISIVAGLIISNSSSGSTTSANFSQANQFYAFNADRAWRLPGYNCIDYRKWGDHNKGDCNQTDGWHSSPHIPGVNSFFEARLTAIPVSTATNLSTSNPASSTTGSSGAGSTGSVSSNDSGSGSTGTGSTSNSSTTSTPTLLSSQKVFRVEAGAFLPWVLGHGPGPHPQGFFIGPLAKAGFDTVAGAASADNVILPGGGTGTFNFQTAYKFYAYGARLGNMYLSQSPSRAPLIEHYLDVTFGRYSNLQSYICHNLKGSKAPVQTGSSCLADYPQYFTNSNEITDSRKQLYRIDLEGLVRIPVPATAIPFYIGINANIAQHTWQAQALDHGYAPPDDIRILFGTKIDMGTLLSSLKLGAN